MPKKKKNPGLYSFAVHDSEESLHGKKPTECDTESVEAILSTHGDKRIKHDTKVGSGDRTYDLHTKPGDGRYSSRNGANLGRITVTREVDVV